MLKKIYWLQFQQEKYVKQIVVAIIFLLICVKYYLRLKCVYKCDKTEIADSKLKLLQRYGVQSGGKSWECLGTTDKANTKTKRVTLPAGFYRESKT